MEDMKEKMSNENETHHKNEMNHKDDMHHNMHKKDEEKGVGQGGMISLLIVSIVYALLAGLEIPEGQAFIPWLARIGYLFVGVIIAIIYVQIVNKYFVEKLSSRVIIAVVSAIIIAFAGFYLHQLLAPYFV